MYWALANGKAPPVLPTSEKPLLNVEGLNDARTKLANFFSILLEFRNRIDDKLKPGRDSFLPVPLFVLTVPYGK